MYSGRAQARPQAGNCELSLWIRTTYYSSAFNMSSSDTRSHSAVPPMAHCWQCDTDIRPLTSPNSEELTCPRCGGSFVELLPERDEEDVVFQGFGGGGGLGDLPSNAGGEERRRISRRAAEGRQDGSGPHADAELD
ncbi:hypothetical protein A4X09_0g7095 [Tilletia walkeri]|uniref:RING-type E3 ubiquitin transferase n=1 Tax=Tilletia walkeri TaxID=117179 RepID=A0A8X7N1K9_9BASI|nr:hypothetical protein A4X09_0g7095 [Tilletia walkeri]